MIKTSSGRICLLTIASTSVLAACSPDVENAVPPPPRTTVSEWVLEDTAAVTAPDTVFSLKGTIRYQDRLYGGDIETGYGFIATEYKPIRHALVELVNEDDQVLAGSTTGSNGEYALDATGGGQLRLRVLAQTDETSGIALQVNASPSSIISVSRGVSPEPGENRVEMDIPIELNSAIFVAGAFNILDVFTAGAEFVKAHADSYPGHLTAIWKPGSIDGTYADASGLIYILGGDGAGGGDTDEFDDDVLWHEYGHFLEIDFNNIDSQGGWHALGESHQDLRLAWSEGWSNYLVGAIKSWLSATSHRSLSAEVGMPSSMYVDTADSIGFIVYDFDKSASDQYQASNEVAVAKVLWNLQNAYDRTTIWSTFSNALPARQFPASLETFWDGWLSQGKDAAAIDQFLAQQVQYQADAFEPEPASPRLVSTASSETQNLYPWEGAGTDTDLSSFTATAGQAYRVSTTNLVNGADTYLKVFAPSGTVVGENDNASGLSYVNAALRSSQNVHEYDPLHGYHYLASRVEFRACNTGDYTIEVTHPELLPAMSGRYGGYTLKVDDITTDSTLPPC